MLECGVLPKAAIIWRLWLGVEHWSVTGNTLHKAHRWFPVESLASVTTPPPNHPNITPEAWHPSNRPLSHIRRLSSFLIRGPLTLRPVEPHPKISVDAPFLSPTHGLGPVQFYHPQRENQIKSLSLTRRTLFEHTLLPGGWMLAYTFPVSTRHRIIREDYRCPLGIFSGREKKLSGRCYC